MQRSLHDAWWRLTTTPPSSFADHLLSGLLGGGALLYGTGVALKNQAYDRGWVRQATLPCPVISVGNLSLGGTGKTACVEYLAAKLLQQGLRVCILSRGYGGRSGRPYWLRERQGQLLVNGEPIASPDGLPDEPQLLARRLSGVPVVVGARREQTGLMACEEFHAEAVILDDGFQHRRVFRDLDVVLVNARMPLGGGALLPRGPMREPLESLARAHVIVITKADQSLELVAALQERLRAVNPDAVIATAVHEPDAVRDWATGAPVELERLAAGRVALLSSIGDPEGFEQTVRGLDAAVASHAVFPDHYRYRAPEWERILRRAAASGAAALVTTEKDAVRLQPFRRPVDSPAAVDTSSPARIVPARSQLPVLVLSVRMRLLSGEEQLNDRLVRVGAR